MRIRPSDTIADIDEALAHLSAALHAAAVLGNGCRILVLWRHVDDLLDARLTRMPPRLAVVAA